MHLFGTAAYLKNPIHTYKLEPIVLEVKYLGDATDEMGLFGSKKAYKVYDPKLHKIQLAAHAVFDGVTTVGESSLGALDWADELHDGNILKRTLAHTSNITTSDDEDDDLPVSRHTPLKRS